MMLYLQLFLEFLKTGLFAIGGGMATIPFLYEMSDKTQWFTHQDLANIIAVGESTPGPIGVNMATYVGFITGSQQGGVLFGILGAVIATLGLITPSVIIVLLVSLVLNSFRNHPLMNSAFYGLRPASTGLIAAAGLSVIVSNLLDVSQTFGASFFQWKAIALAVVLFLLTNVIKVTKKWHPIVWIALSAVAGIVFSM